MRTPTPRDVLYRWHRAALNGERPPITTQPEAGWFLTGRGKSNGWAKPGSIFIRQEIDPDTGELMADETLCAEIMGEPIDVDEAWMRLSRRPICRLEYLRRMGELI